MRQLSNWLESYLEYTKRQESPEIFNFWVGISVVSTTVDRKVWVDLDTFRVYPNHYIVVLADSSIYRKSTSLNIGVKLLRKSGYTRFAPDKITDAGIWNRLGRFYKENDKGNILVYSDELRLFLSPEEAYKSVVPTLTRAYECPDLMEKETITGGEKQVGNVCFNVLVATNPTDFSKIFPETIIGQGFGPRCHIITPGILRNKNSKPRLNRKIEENLIKDLGEINRLNGEIKIKEEAWEWYDNWYINSHNLPNDESLDGFYGRKQIHILKLAQVLSISESDNMVIENKHIQESLKHIERLEQGMILSYRKIGQSDLNSRSEKLLKQIVRYGGEVTRSKLLKMNWGTLSATELNEIISNLIAHEKIGSTGERPVVYKIKQGEK